MMICWAACSVTIVEMMQVKRIIMMMPLSTSPPMRYCPGAVSICIPTMAMAMAPAAWAEVSPNIMWPDDSGRRKRMLAK